MTAYVARRLAQALVVFVGISLVVFLLLHLTGDPAALLLPIDATAEDVARFRKDKGFDQPLYRQYARFLAGAVAGDFGNSFRHNESALLLVLERMPATLELSAGALVVALAVALPVGILAAVRQDRMTDHLALIGATVGQSMPVFWSGIMMVLLFSVQWRILPVSGRGTLAHLVLPALALGLFTTARITRLVRVSVVEIFGDDYIRTARAKGLQERVVVLKHALKNAAIPIVTIIGLEFGTLLGGAVITETIFAWPGVGRFTVEAIYYKDYPVVQAAVLLLASLFVFINLAVDLLYCYLDPRIRYRA